MKTAKQILEEGATHIGWDVGDMLGMAGVQEDLRNVED